MQLLVKFWEGLVESIKMVFFIILMVTVVVVCLVGILLFFLGFLVFFLPFALLAKALSKNEKREINRAEIKEGLCIDITEQDIRNN